MANSPCTVPNVSMRYFLPFTYVVLSMVAVLEANSSTYTEAQVDDIPQVTSDWACEDVEQSEYRCDLARRSGGHA